jgi:Fe-S-cluster containining protein
MTRPVSNLPVRLALYRSADEQTAALATATGLACPSGCGHCCQHHKPEVTVADMMPVAEAVVRDGRGDGLYELARARGGAEPCVFFVPGRLPGGCTMYELRPLLCRLFGFAAVRNKHGRAELAVCHVHKEETPAVAASAAAHVAAGGAVAMFAELQAEADGLDPDRARSQLPINLALVQALEIVLLRQQLSGS